MSKRVQITSEIQSRIRAALGDPEADTSQFVVYEAKLISTEQLKNRRGGLFKNAKMTAGVLSEMSDFLAKEGTVPLQIMHNTEVLPIGKLFYAKTQLMGNGETELRGQFFLPSHKTDIIADLDSGVIDEVSINILTKHLYCSECTFDYLGEEATFENRYELTCNNGHTIGVDGVHVRGVGLDTWTELSLVGKGAATKAKILPRIKQTLGADKVERLAAKGMSFEAILFTSSSKMEDDTLETNKGDPEMDMKDFVAELKATTSELAEKTVKLTQATTQIEELKEQLTALKAEIETHQKEVAQLKEAQTTDQTELNAELTAAKAELQKAAEMLAPHIKAALVASGVDEKEVPTELTAQIKMIEDKGLKLHQMITPGAKSVTNVELSDTQDLRKNSFKLTTK